MQKRAIKVDMAVNIKDVAIENITRGKKFGSDAFASLEEAFSVFWALLAIRSSIDLISAYSIFLGLKSSLIEINFISEPLLKNIEVGKTNSTISRKKPTNSNNINDVIGLTDIQF